MFDVFLGVANDSNPRRSTFMSTKYPRTGDSRHLAGGSNSLGSELINVYMQVVRLAVPPGTGDLDQQLPF